VTSVTPREHGDQYFTARSEVRLEKFAGGKTRRHLPTSNSFMPIGADQDDYFTRSMKVRSTVFTRILLVSPLAIRKASLPKGEQNYFTRSMNVRSTVFTRIFCPASM